MPNLSMASTALRYRSYYDLLERRTLTSLREVLMIFPLVGDSQMSPRR